MRAVPTESSQLLSLTRIAQCKGLKPFRNTKAEGSCEGLAGFWSWLRDKDSRGCPSPDEVEWPLSSRLVPLPRLSPVGVGGVLLGECLVSLVRGDSSLYSCAGWWSAAMCDPRWDPGEGGMLEPRPLSSVDTEQEHPLLQA